MLLAGSLLLALLLSSGLVASTSSPASAPVIVGWGGTQLEEVSDFSGSSPASLVFAGEQASDQEMQVQRLNSMGFNAVRVSFESQCTPWKEAGPYSSLNLERSFRIAEHYSFWMIVDYHGFNDTATSGTVNCWLGFWSSLIQQFKTRYYRTIWEPVNEPTGLGYNHAAVQALSIIYQQWVNQTRSLGDTNWVVVQNLCSFRCDFASKADGYPTVTDPLGKVLISIHPYMSYKFYWNTWDNQTAETRAYNFYNVIKNGTINTGWPVLNTEGGPGGTFNGTQRCPDLVAVGSAGFCRTSFHFIQTLTGLLDDNPEWRVNWTWWTISSRTDTPEAGIYGALDTWGGVLRYKVAFPADVNNDCAVNIVDLVMIANSYGRKSGDEGYFAARDINGDGSVNIFDLALVGNHFGQTCTYRG